MTGETRIEEDAFVARDGARLPLRLWGGDLAEPKAVIVAMHGFNDYSMAFDEPARFLAAEAGIMTYALDQRGFGRAAEPGLWAGTETMTADLAAFSHAVRQRHPDAPLYLLGDSMGGAVVLAALARHPDMARDGAILVAPAVWGRRHLGPIKRNILWLSAHTTPWLRVSGQGLGITPSDNMEMLRKLARDPLIIRETRVDTIWGLVNLMDEAFDAAPVVEGRVLLLYGTKDEIIPVEPTRAAVTAMLEAGRADARVAFYDEGYHMLLRDLGAEIVLRDIAAWVGSPAAPLPSGADARAKRMMAEVK